MGKTSQEKNALQIRARRYFSEDFKRQKVAELEAKQISVQELSALYQVSRTSIYRWLYRYSAHHCQQTRVVVEMESESRKTQRLQERVRELERVVGQKQLEIDFLSKLIEISGQELDIDLKKTFCTKLSSISGSTKPGELQA